MSLTTEQISKFKKANKAYKKVLQVRWGLSDEDVSNIYTRSKKVNTVKEKPLTPDEVFQSLTIFYVIDVSGSMFPNYSINDYNKSKLRKIITAVEKELIAFKQNTSLFFTPKVITFDHKIKNVTIGTNNKLVLLNKCGGTALNDAIVDVCSKASKVTTPTLIKLFTDGEEEHSSKTIIGAKSSIQDLPKNVTFTFVTPKEDANNIRKYKVDPSNCLVFENTVDGVEKAMEETTKATVNYTKAISKGEDVSTGFYSKKLI